MYQNSGGSDIKGLKQETEVLDGAEATAGVSKGEGNTGDRLAIIGDKSGALSTAAVGG
jgi:hypothetical protein